ncbi:MAG: MBL fold metallo-hydrolase [Bauldia sp.]|nr:MBL fold metallo-hydrolase [Bauldia sp.]
MPRLRFTILGCGASPGVPRITGDWGACDPREPKNRRTRAAALFELFGDAPMPTRLVVDTGPDLRTQLLSAGVDELHGVVYTHAHADHVHGIDDLRAYWITGGERRIVTVYSDDATQRRLDDGFGYCFRAPPGSAYPPFLNRVRIVAGTPFRVTGPGGTITVLPFDQAHGDIRSLGIRIGPVAYSCDFNDLPAESLPAVSGADLWVLDALRRAPHPSHCSLSEAIAWVDRIKPQHAVFTHMTNELDYGALHRDLPGNIEPAYDGLRFEYHVAEPQEPVASL